MHFVYFWGMNNDEIYMQRCLELASLGLGKTYPNPIVGSVIVHEDKIIGEGWHQKAGDPHAEVNAVNSVKDSSLLCSATLYVSLEPCAHTGKTPACVNLILKHRIPRVIIGCEDPFIMVSGRSIKKLRDAGVEVISGILESKCKESHKRFYCFHTKQRPYIILKWAESADGFIAPTDQAKGKPLWLTSQDAKILVHKWRTEEASILVGRQTAEMDNPFLTSRKWKGNQPLRLVIDPELKLSKDLHIFDDQSETWVFTRKLKENNLTNKFIQIPFEYPLQEMMGIMHKKNISSILIEGGRETLQNFIKQNLWDEARIFYSLKKLGSGVSAPKIVGTLLSEEYISSDKLTTYIR